MRAFRAGDVRIRVGTRADLMAEAHRAAELLQSGERPDGEVRGPVRAHLAALDRLNAHNPHAAADDTLYVVDEDGTDGRIGTDFGPHWCDARDLPTGVCIRHDGMLCEIATSPTTRNGWTRFVLDAGGRAEKAEYPAGETVAYWTATDDRATRSEP